MKLDYHLMNFTWAPSLAEIGPGVVAIARTAESIGVRTLSLMDHFFQMEAFAPATDPMLECYTGLGFIAGATERLRLRVLVGGVTYRHPGLLAKTVTTLDVLSGGRAEFGIGAAWYEREHRGLGVPFPPIAERFERLEETLRIVLQMWSDDNGAFSGKHYQLAETLCVPAPVSSPRPRIMIGGGGEKKTLRLVAQYADACNFFGGPEEMGHKLDVLRGHCDAIGRDIDEIEVTAMVRPEPDWTPDDVVAACEALGAVGVESAIAVSSPAGDPDRMLETVFGPAMARISAIETSASRAPGARTIQA